MNRTIFSIVAIMMLGAASSAIADSADVNLSKSALNVDFNKMIDEGAHSKKSIQKHLDAQIANFEVDLDDDATVSEKSRVLDFVDVELGFGEITPSNIVDRRFDSISEAQPVTFDLKLVPNFKGGI